jgi:hypothetical protein
LAVRFLDHGCVANCAVSRAHDRPHIVSALKTKRTLTTAQVCDAVMKARNLDTNDKALCRMMMRRTNANLKHWQKKRDLIRSMPGPGQQLLWEIVR